MQPPSLSLKTQDPLQLPWLKDTGPPLCTWVAAVSSTPGLYLSITLASADLDLLLPQGQFSLYGLRLQIVSKGPSLINGLILVDLDMISFPRISGLARGERLYQTKTVFKDRTMRLLPQLCRYHR